MKQTLFTKNQITRFANILDNAGQVILASIVIPFILGVELPLSEMILWLGVLTMFSFWWASLRLERISS